MNLIEPDLPWLSPAPAAAQLLHGLAKPHIGMAPEHELDWIIDPALAAAYFDPARDQRRKARRKRASRLREVMGPCGHATPIARRKEQNKNEMEKETASCDGPPAGGPSDEAASGSAAQRHRQPAGIRDLALGNRGEIGFLGLEPRRRNRTVTRFAQRFDDAVLREPAEEIVRRRREP